MSQAKKLIESAQRYSPYLYNLINSKQISTTQLSSLLNEPLSCGFFHNFTSWDKIENTLNEHQLKYYLSLLRCLTFAQVMVRDLNHLASLEEVMLTMSNLADFCLIKAQRLTEKLYTQRYGEPIGTESQNIQHLTIIAMGKLGGQELNVSSDIDLIFTYPEEGRSSGRRQISLQEFFIKTTQKIIQLIDNTTENGRIFRVDNRLRPYGDSGSIVMSEEALENYLLTQGRAWERYAWIKARVVSPYPNRIKKLITPFVYRKYLDFNSLESMRQLHRQSVNALFKGIFHLETDQEKSPIDEKELKSRYFL
jgi:[glutamine synthetase] adenylyltransferase / [glutamine synthetase]-adenylyl-L-tyrosine phosphorylase